MPRAGRPATAWDMTYDQGQPHHSRDEPPVEVDAKAVCSESIQAVRIIMGRQRAADGKRQDAMPPGPLDCRAAINVVVL